MVFYLTPEEWQAVRLSLAVAMRAVLFGLPLAVAAAYLLSRRRFLGRPLLDALVHLPLVLPPVVIGWGLLLLFGMRGPSGGRLLDWFGVRLVFTMEGAALATAVMSFPLIVRAVRLSLEALDPGLDARRPDLGRGPGGPLLHRDPAPDLARLLAGAVTAFAAGLGEFGAVITFVSNIPGETQTIPLAIYSATRCPAATRARRGCRRSHSRWRSPGCWRRRPSARRMQAWLGR